MAMAGNDFDKLSKVQFKTPEEVAIEDETTNREFKTKDQQKLEDQKTIPNSNMPIKKKFRLKITKKRVGIGLLVIILIIFGYLIINNSNNNFTKIPQKAKTIVRSNIQKSNLVPSNLTGLMVNPSLNQLPVTAVMIENSLQARPQSGLEQAGVVFEAMAEGGITRFMALYQDTAPNYVGPIRSARPYFVSWAMGFDASYAHVGGSPLALTDIQNWGINDLNQFYYGNYYTRITSRQAPHNVYTSLANLHTLESVLHFGPSKFSSWPRKTLGPLAHPTVTNINFRLSNFYFNPSYTFNPKTNSYERFLAGQPEVGTDTNIQYNPKVVIGMVVPETNGPLDSSGAYYSDYSYIGSGQAYIFQNGGLTIGNWSKSSNSSQIMFTTSNGQNIALDPGQVWITVISSTSDVTYN